MCLRAGILIGWDRAAKQALIARANCDSWLCPECAKRMRDNWSLRTQIGVRRMFAEHQFIDFVTLTSHEKLMTFAQTERVFRDAWPNIYGTLKRRNHDLQYLLIPEKHRNGRMHVHALWNAGQGTVKLKNIVRSRGLGYELKVSACANVLNATMYVVKYLKKDLGAAVPPHFHRVRVSQNWPNIPAPNNHTSKLVWEFTRSEPVFWSIMRQCQVAHIDVIDAKNAQPFDANEVDFALMV